MNDEESSRRNPGCWAFFAVQNVVRRLRRRPKRYDLVPSEDTIPNALNLDAFTLKRKTVALQAGVEDNIFEDEWQMQRIREIVPDQENLWIGYTGFLFSDLVQKYRPSLRMGTKRSVDQQKFQQKRASA